VIEVGKLYVLPPYGPVVLLAVEHRFGLYREVSRLTFLSGKEIKEEWFMTKFLSSIKRLEDVNHHV